VNEKYMWGMDNAIQAGNPVEYVTDFVDKPDPKLSPQQRDMITKNMYAALSNHSKSIKQAEAAEKQGREDLYNSTYTELAAQALDNTLDTSTLDEYVRKGILRPNDAFRLREKKEATLSNDFKLMEYELVGVHNYSELDIMEDEELSTKDRLRLLKERKDVIDNQNDWRNSPSGNQGAADIRGELGLVGNNFGMVDEAKARQVTRALNQYWKEVNALPIEKRELAAPDIAMKIVNKIRGNDRAVELKDLKAQRSKMKYQTIEQLEKAIEDGTATNANGIALVGLFGAKETLVNLERSRIERMNKRIQDAEAELADGL
jgi:hypothetical protein